MYSHRLNPYIAVLMVTVFASAATLLILSKVNDFVYSSLLDEELFVAK
jgi:hypothetical protein